MRRARARTRSRRRSRGTPRIANRLLRRVRDFAQVRADGAITRAVAREALAAARGRRPRLRRGRPQAAADHHRQVRRAAPSGVDALAAAISEEPDAIEDIYEPYLLQIGFLDRTPRGPRPRTRRALRALRPRDPPRGRPRPEEAVLRLRPAPLRLRLRAAAARDRAGAARRARRVAAAACCDRESETPRHATSRDLPPLLRAGRPAGGQSQPRARRRGCSAAGAAAARPSCCCCATSPTARARRLGGLRAARAPAAPGRRRALSTDRSCHASSRAPSAADGRRRVRLDAPRGDLERALERAGPHAAAALHPARRHRRRPRRATRPSTPASAGSVAAPTAGCTSRSACSTRLARRGIERAELVLHVGPGTFQPVKVDGRARAPASRPSRSCSRRKRPRPSARARARGGARGRGRHDRRARAGDGRARTPAWSSPASGETDLVVIPGLPLPRRGRALDQLPPAALVAAAAGVRLRGPRAGPARPTAEALASGYRFYSYGDAMLIL